MHRGNSRNCFLYFLATRTHIVWIDDISKAAPPRSRIAFLCAGVDRPRARYLLVVTYKSLLRFYATPPRRRRACGPHKAEKSAPGRFFCLCAQGETRTPMPKRALPPQGSTSTNFATCALLICQRIPSRQQMQFTRFVLPRQLQRRLVHSLRARLPQLQPQAFLQQQYYRP